MPAYNQTSRSSDYKVIPPPPPPLMPETAAFESAALAAATKTVLAIGASALVVGLLVPGARLVSVLGLALLVAGGILALLKGSRGASSGPGAQAVAAATPPPTQKAMLGPGLDPCAGAPSTGWIPLEGGETNAFPETFDTTNTCAAVVFQVWPKEGRNTGTPLEVKYSMVGKPSKCLVIVRPKLVTGTGGTLVASEDEFEATSVAL
ncbi:MAG TPA: hypothetical protein PK413_00465 [Thermoanaerobaculia bacterium]|nr:hypothetical protein [Thermoanaerobaculia bacterium]